MEPTPVAWEETLRKLSEPFDDTKLEWKGTFKPEKVRKMGKQLWLPYVQARAIMDRLDNVVGPGNWHDHYERWGNERGVLCSLTIFGVTKQDAADESDIEGTKGGVSNALKRAAVKFGIGRYLYSQPPIWLPEGQKPGNGGHVYEPQDTSEPDTGRLRDLELNTKPKQRSNYQREAMTGAQLAEAWAKFEETKNISSLPKPWGWTTKKGGSERYADKLHQALRGDKKAAGYFEWMVDADHSLAGQVAVPALEFIKARGNTKQEQREADWLDVGKELDAALDGEGGEVVEPTADEMGW